MATRELLHSFDFTDEDKWRLTGDAVIEDDTLTVADPEVTLNWTVHKWNYVPPEDGNGDRVLETGVEYLAHNNNVALEVEDGWFVFWVKRASTVNANQALKAYFRWSTLTGERLSVQLKGGFTSQIRGVIQMSDLSDVSVDIEWDQDWPAETWRQIFVKFTDDDVNFYMGAQRGLFHKHVDRESAGEVGFEHNHTTDIFTLGGVTQEPPTIYYRRQGAAELKEEYSFTLPAGSLGLGRLMVSDQSFSSGAESFLRIYYMYRLKHLGTWGDWTVVPDDGDLSGLGSTAGDQLLVAVNDSTGVGLDSVDDPRYRPTVSTIGVTYYTYAPESLEGDMKEATNEIKRLLNADGVLSVLTGWGGAHISPRGTFDPPMFETFGVYVCAGTSEFLEVAQHAGSLQAYDRVHTIFVMPTVIDHNFDIEQGLIRDDTGLFDITEAVMTALIEMDLGASYRFSDISDADYDPHEVLGPYETMSLITIKVRAKAEGR